MFGLKDSVKKNKSCVIGAGTDFWFTQSGQVKRRKLHEPIDANQQRIEASREREEREQEALRELNRSKEITETRKDSQ
jgi:hypothetical protein